MSIKRTIEIGNRNAKKTGKKTLEAVSENVKAMYKEMAENNPPYNGATKRDYSGDNVFRLIVAMKQKGFTDPRWYSWGQIQEMGARVKKGEHGTEIIGWWEEDKDDTDGIEGRKTMKPRVYSLFNAEQCTGIAEATEKEETIKKEAVKAPAARFPIIKGSFEIKAKTAKKTEKAEAKKEEKPEEKAPEATEKTAAKKDHLIVAIEAIEFVKKLVAARDGKVCDSRFFFTIRDELQKSLPKGYTAGGNFTKANGGSITVWKACGGVIDIFRDCHFERFTTTAPGKMPRIDAKEFIKILDATKEGVKKSHARVCATVASQQKITATIAAIKEAQRVLRSFDLDVLKWQGVNPYELRDIGL